MGQDRRPAGAAPAAHAFVGTRSTEFFVRFNRPVDHAHSFFAITRDGKVVETLRPRFESGPNVLFARASTLTPGDYIVHWPVCSTMGEVVQGDLPLATRH